MSERSYTLQSRIEELYARPATQSGDEDFRAFDELKAALNEGRVRAAEPDPTSPTGWRVNTWVKKGILLGFRIGRVVEMPGWRPEAGMRPPVAGSSWPMQLDRQDGDAAPESRRSETAATDTGPKAGATEKPQNQNTDVALPLQFRDKHTYPLKEIPDDRNIRVVPGGSSIRDGCYIGKGVVCMPPMYVNTGSYVDDGTMIDSHALVGSCAQVGKRVHISAGAQIGGVLEPIGAMPVIIEDDVLVGGNCGVYEGTIVGKEVVLAAGTILTGSTPVYDLVRDTVYRREGDKPLMIPPGAVVVPGSRAVTQGRGKELGISLYTPVIIKYRDEKTDQAVRLEDLLR
jgi:2,3,4,5-tetrahydropyridine-2-carboxylate N-succinyltransferase